MGEGTGSGKGLMGGTEHAQVFPRTAEKTPPYSACTATDALPDQCPALGTQKNHTFALEDLSSLWEARFGHSNRVSTLHVANVLIRYTQHALGVQ